MSTLLTWYRVEVVNETSVALQDIRETAWLTHRSGRQLYFADGHLADVETIMDPVTSADKLMILTAGPVKAPVGSIVYVTLPEWFPTTAAEVRLCASIWSPLILNQCPYPYMGHPQSTNLIMPSPVNNFGAKVAPHSDVDDDGSAWGITDALGGSGSGGRPRLGRLVAATVRKNGCECCQDAGSPFRVVLVTLLLLGLLILPLWADLEICMAIGRVASSWAVVFAWLFLGNLAFCVLIGGIAAFAVNLAFGEKELAGATLITTPIALFIFSCAFGAPLAWLEGKDRAAEDYLRESAFKQLNCWRNPNERLSMTDHHFIHFEESDWVVDYRLRSTQGVSTLMGTDDEGDDDGSRYNYCVAPIVYRGVPNCPQDLWAACFRQTAKTYLASCDDNDAKTCGWNFASSNNILRTLNRNEEFWSNVEEEDEDQWRKAWSYAPTRVNASSTLPVVSTTVNGSSSGLSAATPVFSSTPVSRILGFYSGEGPSEILAFQEETGGLSFDLFIVAMVLYGVVMIILYTRIVINQEPAARCFLPVCGPCCLGQKDHLPTCGAADWLCCACDFCSACVGEK